MKLSELSKIIFSESGMLREFVLDVTEVKSETLQMDQQGNFLWANNHSGNTTLVLFRTQPNGIIVEQTQKKSYLASPLGKNKIENMTDVVCVSRNGAEGIVRKSDVKKDVMLLKSKAELAIGEIFFSQPYSCCKENLLYGCQVSSLVMLHLAISAIKSFKDSQRPVAVAFVNESLSGREATLRFVAKTRPTQLLVCYTAEEKEAFLSGQGPGVVIKDGSCVVNPLFRQKIEQAAQACNIKTQNFIGNTDSALERIYLTAKTKELGAIYLPVAAYNSRLEEIDKKDVEKTQALLLKYIENFDIIIK